MYVCRISVTKYPYPFKQRNYYPHPIRIRENYGYPQNTYPRISEANFAQFFSTVWPGQI